MDRHFKSFERISEAIVVGVALVALGCGQADGERSSPDVPSGSGTTKGLSATAEEVAAGKQIELTALVEPNADCLAEVEGADDSAPKQRTFADDSGQTRLYIWATSMRLPRVSLRCKTRSGEVITDMKRTPSGVPWGLDFTARRRGRIRPALVGDPMRPSQDELVTAGYPPRPDRGHDPAGFSDWLFQVSHEFEEVVPRLVKLPEHFHGPMANGAAGSTNWSGQVITRPGAKFDLVTGRWVVPRADNSPVAAPSPSSQCFAAGTYFSSMWIGLDGGNVAGARSTDVVQDGTEQDVNVTVGRCAIIAAIGSYYPWIEWYPNVAQGVSNLSVSPGHQISSQVWMGTSSSTLNQTGPFAWFIISNNTTGRFVKVSLSAPGGTTFKGDSAEWVVERPQVGSTLTTLANYGSANMADAKALDGSDGNSVWHLMSDVDPLTSLNMVNGSKLLSSSSVTSSTSASFTWVNFR